MTPKEKAKELVNKFEPYMPFIDQIDYSINLDKRTRHAKHCALIVADESIDQWEYIDTYISNLNGELNTNLRYWYEVKEEIIRL